MPVVAGTQYATRTDLANLGMIGGALSTVSATTQDAALVAASATADACLSSRYELPLSSWGTDLVRAVCCIAAYDVLTSRGFGLVGASDENIRKRYEDAIEWLRLVSQDKATPSHVVDSSSSDGEGQDGSISTSTHGAFQMETSPVRGWTDRGGPPGSAGNFWDKI